MSRLPLKKHGQETGLYEGGKYGRDTTPLSQRPERICRQQDIQTHIHCV